MFQQMNYHQESNKLFILIQYYSVYRRDMETSGLDGVLVRQYVAIRVLRTITQVFFDQTY